MKIALFSVLLFCVLASGKIHFLPLGVLEASLANSGVTLQSSTASLYYNPSLLVTLQKNRISGSASNLGVIGVKAEQFSGKNFQSTPSAIVSAYKNEKTTFAFGLLNPASIDIKFEMYLPTKVNEETINSKVNIETRFDEIYLGMGFGQQLNKNWSIGASLFGHRIFNSSYTAYRGEAKGLEGLFGYSEYDSSAINLLGVLGLSYFSKEWNLGVNVFLPEIQLEGESKRTNSAMIYLKSANFFNLTETTEQSGYTRSEMLGVDFGANFNISPEQVFYFSLHYADLPIVIEDNPSTTAPSWGINVGYNLNSWLVGVQRNITRDLDRKNKKDERSRLITLGRAVEIGSLISSMGAYYGEIKGENQTTTFFYGVSLSSSYSY